MHRHLHVVRTVAQPERPPRPAKVVSLDARRLARARQTPTPERQPPRPAA